MNDEIRELRAAKRAHRQAKIALVLKDLMTIPDRDPSTRKIQAHPGQEAARFVQDTLAEFDVPGKVTARYSRSNREAGLGAHGILDGTIHVSVELKPFKGKAQFIEIPIEVKASRMLQPGLLYHHGQPMVISQSALDDVMADTYLSDEPRIERGKQFSPPGKRNIDSEKAYRSLWARLNDDIYDEDGDMIRRGTFVEILDLTETDARIRDNRDVEALISRSYLDNIK